MTGMIIRLVVNAIAIAITASVVPGIAVRGGIGTYLILALIFGIVNALIKPIVKLLTCPLIIVTLGLFIFVINGSMLMLTSTIAGENVFKIENLWAAILGGIVMGVVNILLEGLVGMSKKES